MSLPCASGVMPAATDADAPPLLPPGVCWRDHGLYVRPRKSLTVSRRKLNAGVLVRPMMIAPAFFQLATIGLSAVAIDVAKRLDAVDRRAAFLVDVLLDRDRHAVQRARGRRRARPPRRRDPACASACSDRSTVTALSARIDLVHARDARRHGIARARSSRLRIAAASAAASHFQSGSLTVLVARLVDVAREPA